MSHTITQIHLRINPVNEFLEQSQWFTVRHIGNENFAIFAIQTAAGDFVHALVAPVQRLRLVIDGQSVGRLNTLFNNGRAIRAVQVRSLDFACSPIAPEHVTEMKRTQLMLLNILGGFPLMVEETGESRLLP